MKNREKDIFGERRGNGAGGTLQKLAELTEITLQRLLSNRFSLRKHCYKKGS